MHLHFRRSAHSFSLADLPFVFGLAFASGDGFLLGALSAPASPTPSAGCRRSSSPSISRSSRWPSASPSVIVRAIAGPPTRWSRATWIALYVATLATGALSIACIAGAIAIAEGGMAPRRCARCSRWTRRHAANRASRSRPRS